MARKLALGACAVVVIAAVIASQPASFAVERATAIQAPPEIVYARIESLRAMDAWSPFAQRDPQMRIRYEGPESGVGAMSSWEGPQMGKGRIRIIAVEPPRQIEMKLEMLSPMRATNRILFTLVPTDAVTRVTWRMEGRNDFVGKAMGLILDIDEMVGGDFEKGLLALRASAEADAARRNAELAYH